MEIERKSQEEGGQEQSILEAEAQGEIIIIKETEKEAPIGKKQASHEQPDDESNTLIPARKQETARRYGNNIVLIDTKFLTIMLGPDYLCFLPTFLFFSVFAYLLVQYINTNVTNIYAIVATNVICIGQSLSYLLVAISDPGIAHPLTSAEERSLSNTSFCRKCRFVVPEKTFHCSYCDVCIVGYDHHCPWTSKCIGKNNLIRFYIFLFSTPVFIVYSAFAFGFTADAVMSSNHLKRLSP